MMVSFQVLIAIVKWVMLHLGRPLNSAGVLSPTGMPAVPMMAPGYGSAPWQLPAGQPAYPQVAANGHNGQAIAANGQSGRTVSGEELKRRIVEAYLSGWTTEAIAATTAQEVEHALANEGVTVSQRTVSTVLTEVRAQRGLPAVVQRPAPGGRQRGSAAARVRKPRKP